MVSSTGIVTKDGVQRSRKLKMIIKLMKKNRGNVNCENIIKKSNRKDLVTILSSVYSATTSGGKKGASGSKASHAMNDVIEIVVITINIITI
jgi:hypothetical protein